MAPRSSAAAGRLLPLLLLALLLSSAALLVAVVEAVPRLDAFVGDDLDSDRPASSRSSPDAVAAAARESGTPLDDLTAFWLENADELRARDARLSPEARAQELARRETEWRNAARRKEQAERMERGVDSDEEEEEREGNNKSLKEMERERKKFKKEEKEAGKDSATEGQEGSLDPGVIDSATLYSPPKATAFRAQGDAPAKISLGKMLTEGKKKKVLFFFLFFFFADGRERSKWRGKKKKKLQKTNFLSLIPQLVLRQATTPRPAAAASPQARPASRRTTSRAWSSTPST